MEEKSKLFVFDKKEVALIFLFMLLISALSFTLGVNIGKKLTITNSGYTSDDIRNIEKIQSKQEEKYNEMNEAPPKEDDAAVNERLQKEFEKLNDTSATEKKTLDSDASVALPNMPSENIPAPNISEPTNVNPDDIKSNITSINLKGKYTVQLGSYPDANQAQDFAEGFTARGYDPIINEVEIAGKGKWYRVSIGIFDSIPDAKDYIKKEKSLFQGKDYFIKDFQ